MNNQDSASYAALILRISLGLMFIAHALLKIMAFTPAGTVGFFASLGVPGWFAYPVMGAELVGGILLVAGIQTRIVAVALVPVLIGAIVLVHGANGWLYTNENGGWEYSAFLVMASFAQALLGDGACSAGALFNRRAQRARIANAGLS
jgi:putative oxidoreductase